MFDGPLSGEPDFHERRARLRLSRTRRIGPASFQEALSHFGSARAACRELPVVPDAEIAREEEQLDKLGGRLIVIGDADYPAALAALPDAPPVLSALGDIALASRRAIAVVGAREASFAGKRFAAQMAADLGAAGFCVTSGLARGIDTAAHTAALPTGTVAVLAGGIDQIYPLQNAELYRAIAEQGLILSEMPLGTPAVARSFPRRNRIVSGLSLGVMVIEAAEKSGSLITAHRAAEQGRDVFVVPGSPMDPRYGGSNNLLKDGAILTRNANDIIGVFEALPPARQALGKSREKPSIAGTEAVVEALGSVPTAVDELVRRCQVSAATVAEVLLSLELEGRLERHRGNRVSLI